MEGASPTALDRELATVGTRELVLEVARRTRTAVVGEEKPGRGTTVAWIALIIVWLVVTAGVSRWDFRDVPRTGDENNSILQALSLAYDGHNLSYDGRDVDRWADLEWARTPRPQGFFFRTYEGGFAFSKPYGYSLWLAPAVRAFGAPDGIALANAALLTALLATVIAILRTRMSGPGVPLLAGAFVFGSYVYMYAFTTAVDLWFATVVAIGCLAFLRAWTNRSAWWAALGVVAMSVCLADRLTVGLALLPALVIVLTRVRTWRTRGVLVGLAVLVYAAGVSPFLYYSDGHALSPYAKPRYYASGAVIATPFEEWKQEHPDRESTGRRKPDSFTPAGVWHRLTDKPDQVPEATAYFLVGRHTGLLPFIPIALFSLGLAVARWRRLDSIGWAFLGGIVLYCGLYLVLYTSNFYGGGQSLGNRYFLQIAPLVLGVLVTLRLSTRLAVILAAVSIALSLVFLWPHHLEPDRAYLDIPRTTPVQRLLPFEENQSKNHAFECAGGFGYRPPCAR